MKEEKAIPSVRKQKVREKPYEGQISFFLILAGLLMLVVIFAQYLSVLMTPMPRTWEFLLQPPSTERLRRHNGLDGICFPAAFCGTSDQRFGNLVFRWLSLRLWDTICGDCTRCYFGGRNRSRSL